MKKSINIQKLLHHKSKHHETKPMHPSSFRAFQRYQERNRKHPGLMDLTNTNKTKQTTFLHKLTHLPLIINIFEKKKIVR